MQNYDFSSIYIVEPVCYTTKSIKYMGNFPYIFSNSSPHVFPAYSQIFHHMDLSNLPQEDN